MAELNEEQLRIRGYLQAQAAKLTVPQLLDKVRTDMAQLKAAAEAGERVDYARRPSEDDWSVNEVMAHITDTCASVNSGILGAWERGERPAGLTDALKRSDDVVAPMVRFKQLTDEREALFARLAVASGDEHLDVKWRHGMFGDLNWREWVLFLRIHDMDHARQVEGIVTALA